MSSINPNRFGGGIIRPLEPWASAWTPGPASGEATPRGTGCGGCPAGRRRGGGVGHGAEERAAGRRERKSQRSGRPGGRQGTGWKPRLFAALPSGCGRAGARGPGGRARRPARCPRPPGHGPGPRAPPDPGPRGPGGRRAGARRPGAGTRPTARSRARPRRAAWRRVPAGRAGPGRARVAVCPRGGSRPWRGSRGAGWARRIAKGCGLAKPAEPRRERAQEGGSFLKLRASSEEGNTRGGRDAGRKLTFPERPLWPQEEGGWAPRGRPAPGGRPGIRTLWACHRVLCHLD